MVGVIKRIVSEQRKAYVQAQPGAQADRQRRAAHWFLQSSATLLQEPPILAHSMTPFAEGGSLFVFARADSQRRACSRVSSTLAAPLCVAWLERWAFQIMLHELWIESDGEQTFCQAGAGGTSARGLLQHGAKLVWSVEGSSYFEAMTKYYEYMGWGEYESDQPALDKQPYLSPDPEAN
jgi:hypothetical protein